MKQIDTGTMALNLLYRRLIDVANDVDTYARDKRKEAIDLRSPAAFTEATISERIGEALAEVAYRIKEDLYGSRHTRP